MSPCSDRYGIGTRLALYRLMPLLLLALFGACAAGGLRGRVQEANPMKAGALPDWVLRHPSQYPSDLYLVGVGSAPTSNGLSNALEAASASARAELIQAIEVHISHSQQLSRQSRSLEKSTNGRVQLAYNSERSNVASLTNTATDQMARGIEIKETFYNANDQVFYALAVLEKETAAQRLRRQMDQLSDAIDGSIELARRYESKKDLLMSIRYYRRAYRQILQFETVRNRQQVLDAQGRYRKTQKSSDEIERTLGDLLHRYRLVVRMNADPTPGILEALQMALIKSGFTIGREEGKEEPGATLWGDIQTEWDVYRDAALDRDLQVCRMSLSIRIVDRLSQNTVGQINLGENGNGQTKDRALRGVLRLMERRIADELPQSLYEILSVGMEM
jgi:hypothetical protein